QNGVLSRQIDRIVAGQAVAERGVGKVTDRRVDVVHAHGNTGRRSLVDFVLDDFAIFTDELDRQRTLAREQEVGGLVLVTKGVTANDDRLGPARHQTRYVRADDRLAED